MPLYEWSSHYEAKPITLRHLQCKNTVKFSNRKARILVRNRLKIAEYY